VLSTTEMSQLVTPKQRMLDLQLSGVFNEDAREFCYRHAPSLHRTYLRESRSRRLLADSGSILSENAIFRACCLLHSREETERTLGLSERLSKAGRLVGSPHDFFPSHIYWTWVRKLGCDRE